MRDPDNLHRFVDYAEDVPNFIDLPELDPFTKPDYDLNDEKEYDHYLRDIEKVVRGSFEYQKMVGFLRENLDMNQCSFYQGVSNITVDSQHRKIYGISDDPEYHIVEFEY